jgi:4-hydroxy-tetrahydrodipicolinate synthase
MSLLARLDRGLVPAVPVPFRGRTVDREALARYTRWMAAQPIAGVAVGVHTGRGRHLAPEERRLVLAAWRTALPDRVIVAGAWDDASAREAREGGADALLAFPEARDPARYHERLSRELPVIAFYLYEAAGGVAYDDAALHAILSLPHVVGIKVATLDSVMTFQRIARLLQGHPDKLLITGEDRFLGYSLMLGARAALIGMGAALTDLQAALLPAKASADWSRFMALSALCDRFAQVTFVAPMEGYIRRMLWAAAADGALPDEACDDPWGPELAASDRNAVRQAVHDARSALR